jgi:DnaJ like chaperone protein
VIVGRVLGLVIGVALFRLPGAFLGFFIGYLVDKVIGYAAQVKFSPEEKQRMQESFMRTLFLSLGHLAKADGKVSPREIEMTEYVMTHLQLDAPSREEAISLFREGKSLSREAILNKLMDLKKMTKGHWAILNLFMEFQFQVAFSEGEVGSQDLDVLKAYAKCLGYSAFQFDRLYTMHRAHHFFHERYTAGFGQQSSNSYRQGSNSSRSSTSTLSHAYGVLGLKPGVTKDEVKKAYRKLMNEYHPDKLASKGLPESMMRAATEKAQEIGQAYELILKSLD